MDESKFPHNLSSNLSSKKPSFDAHKGLIVAIGFFLVILGIGTFFQHKFNFISKLPGFSRNVDKDVLAAYDIVPYTQLQSNLKYVFNNSAEVLNGMRIRGDVDADGSNVTLGEGTIIASNIIYSIIAGDGITITPGQNPTISVTNPTVTGVTTIEDISGAVDLIAGNNISLSTDGNKITINSTSSGADGNTTYTAGEGLALTDTTFSVDYNGIGLSDLGTSNTTSGASVIGVYSGNFTNIMVASPGTDLQTVLEAIDTELTSSGGGGIAAVGNISSGNAFTSGVPGSNLFIANTGWIGLGSGAGRIVWNDSGTDQINLLGANVGIGSTNPNALFTVGNNNQFSIDSTGLVTLGGLVGVTDPYVVLVPDGNGSIRTISTSGWDRNGSDDLVTSTQFSGDVLGLYSNLQIGATTVGATELASSGVTSGGYGGSDGTSVFIPQLTIDEDGRITTASTIVFTPAPGSSLTVGNGLSQSGSNIYLGGSLSENTRFFTTGTEVFYMGTNGQIGIGTTTPGVNMRLDVDGNINTSGDFYIDNIALGSTGGGALIGVNSSGLNYSSATNIQQAIEDLDNAINNFGVGGSGAWLDGGNYVYINPSLATYLGNSAQGGTNKLSGAYFSDGSLVSLGTDNDYRLVFDGNSLLLGNTSSTYLSVGDSGTTGNFNFNNNQFYIRGDGNIGVGTTAPGYKVDIAGGLRVGGTAVFSTVPSISDNNSLLTLSSGVLSSIDSTNWDKNGSDDLSTTTVFLGDVSGPYNNLQINPNTVDSTELVNTGVTVGSYGGVGGTAIYVPSFTVDADGRLTSASTTPFVAGTNFESPLTFANGLTRTGNSIAFGGTLNSDTNLTLGSNNFTMMGAGSVGIGTTSITAGIKLDVAGNIRAGTDIYIGSIALGGTGGAGVVGFNDLNNTLTYVDSSTVQNAIEDLNSAIEAIASGTSVAWTDAGVYLHPTNGEFLGNTAPGGSNKLAGIYLGETSPIYFGTDNDFRLGFNGTNLALGDSSNTFLSIGDSGTTGNFNFNQNQFYIQGGGNIGIGTTAPSYKLDVAGTARAWDLIAQNISLSSLSTSLINAQFGHTGYTNFSGGIGTGGNGKDSILGAQRLTSAGNLTNIGSYQGGEMLLTNGGTFATKVDYAGAANPASVAMGDVNGDGKLDFVTADYSDNTISVYINNGNGTFASRVTYATTNIAVDLAIGDINGDGKSDIAVTNAGGPDTVSVFINNGNGTFATKVDYATGDNPYGVAIGDVNGDGKADLAVTNANASTVSILINNGNGTFATKVDYVTGTGPRLVAIGDVNGDGKADLAVANGNVSTVSVFINNGNGTFASKVDYATGSGGSHGVVMGDVSGDGKADLAVTNANISANSMSVFINNGNGTFASKVDYATGTNVQPIAMGDINGDGKADLITGNTSSTNASVFMNTGDGTFATKVDYTTGANPYGVAIGDVNGDGKKDFVTANFGSSTVSVFFNNVNPIFYAQASTGRVGIGTTSPSYTLDVAGNIRAGTDVYIGSVALGATGGASVLGFNDLNNTLTYVDASTVQNAIEDLNSAIGTIASGTSVSWTDAGTYLYPTNYASNVALGNPIGGGSAKLNNIYVDSSKYLVLGQQNNYWLGYNSTATKMELQDVAANVFLSVGDSGTTGNFNFNNNQVYIRGDGYVGIGTTAPVEKFEISNNGEVYARISNTLSTGAAGVSLISGNAYSLIFTNSQSQNEYGGANSLNLYGGPNSPIAFLVNDTPAPAMFITTSGNVGIGTTAPTANMALDVIGNIRAGTDVYIGNIALGSTGGAGLIGVNTAGFTFTTAPTVQGQLTALNTGIGTTSYSSTNYVTAGSSLGASIGTLDSAIQNLAVGNSGLWRDTNGATAGGNVYLGDTTSNFAIGGTNSNAPFYVSPVLGASINVGSTAAFTIGNTANDIFTFNTDINAGLDLFSLNVPSGTSNIANLFAIYDNGSPIFTVSQAQIESAVPHVFSAAGDVSIAYDLIFSNETSSNIKSNGPLTIESGEVFENNDLTFRTFGSGNIILETNTGNLKVAGGSIIGGTYMSLGMTSPLNGLLVEGRVAIGATAPTANMALDVVGNIRAGTDVYIGSIRLGQTGTTNLTSGAGKIGLFNEFGSIAIGSSTVQDGLDDLDAAVGNILIGSSGLWLDGGNYTYLNTAYTNGIIGNTVPGGANKISGLFLTDTAPVWFGLDNDFKMQFNTTNLSIGDSSNNFLTIADAGTLGTLAFNTDDLYVSGTNSRVGIGTATPLGVLDVRGDIFTDRWLLSATNTGVGSSVYGGGALSHTTANEGWYNTAFGANALYSNTTGFMNTALGQQAGNFNTTGDSNIAIGHQSLVFNQSGDHNVAVGVIAGYGVVSNSSSDNTLIGYSTGFSLSSSTGRNTLIGSQAGDQITSGTGNIVIGYNIDAPSATGNNQLNIGGLLMGTLGVGATINGNAVLGSSGSSAHTILGTVTAATLYTTTVGVTNRDLFVDNTGVVGYVSSSQRYKEDINYLNDVDWLYNLKPVNYVYKNDSTKALQYGLIAEEVNEINPLLVSYNDQGLPETVTYSKLITPLLKAVQDQRSTLTSLSNDFATLALPDVDSFVNVNEFDGLETEFSKLEQAQTVQQSEIVTMQSQIQDLMNRIDLAEPIASEESKVDNLADRVSFLEQMLFGKEASSSAELAELINNTDEYPDGEVLGIEDGKLTVEDLTVTGKTNLFDLGIVGDLSAGQIVVRGNEAAINSLGLPLEIQSEATAPIQLMAGNVVIDTDGNVMVKKEITAKKYNVDTTNKESASIGKGSIKVGETEVIIKSTSVTGSSNIFLTPTVETDMPLAVVEKIAGNYFKVKIVKEAEEDISFNWWIVN